MTYEHYEKEYLLPSNKYIEDCDFVPENPFIQEYVSQVVESSGNQFNDKCGTVWTWIFVRERVQKKKSQYCTVSIRNGKV